MDRRTDDVIVEERYIDERRGGGAGRWILAVLAIAVLAVVAFFAFGGEADIDTEGDVEVPEVDVDVNAPDVDTEDAPPASAEAN